MLSKYLEYASINSSVYGSEKKISHTSLHWHAESENHYLFLSMCPECIPVAQRVDHAAGKAKVTSSVPREQTV